MFYHLSWGGGIWSECFSCICLFVLYGLVSTDPSSPREVIKHILSFLIHEPQHDKTNKMTSVCPAKTRISLGIRPVWSESLLSAWRNIKSLATHWAHSIRPVWSESSLGAHWSFCWFCHVAAHVSKSLKYVLSPFLGKRDLVWVLLVHLFVCFIRVSFCHFLFLLVLGAGCVCDWGTPWTFLLPVIGKTTEFIFFLIWTLCKFFKFNL